MRRTRLHRWPCSLARTVDILGDWWTPMILREAFFGVTKFDDFEGALGLGRNVLTERLKRLVKEGVLARHAYQQHPERYEYVLTPKGEALLPVLVAMMHWGDAWLSGHEGVPVELVNAETGEPIQPVLIDERSGIKVERKRLRARPGPGFSQAYGGDITRPGSAKVLKERLAETKKVAESEGREPPLASRNRAK